MMDTIMLSVLGFVLGVWVGLSLGKFIVDNEWVKRKL
jgi:ABC-type nitrate/sulfonate/bicarbonate transport system permease component